MTYCRTARLHNPTLQLLKTLPIALPTITAYGATLPIYRPMKRPLLTGIDDSTPGFLVGVALIDHAADATMVRLRGRFTCLIQRSSATASQSLRIAAMASECEGIKDGLSEEN